MADEPQVLSGINWREVFPFTHIFRAFRIAIHPSKLVLALAAILALYFGGRILDALWASSQRAVPGEIVLYAKTNNSEEFQTAREEARKGAERQYARMLQAVAASKLAGGDAAKVKDGEYWKAIGDDSNKALEAARNREGSNDVRYWINAQRQQRVDEAQEQYNADNKKPNSDARALAQQLRTKVHLADAEAAAGQEVVSTIAGRGLFDAFVRYETAQIQRVVQGVLGANWLGGFPGIAAGEDGVYRAAFNFFAVAPAWALVHHPLYFVLYGALFLLVWSLFGGAIARIAAVHVADEGRKLSMRQGLSFAVSKFLSFLSAPLIPLVIVGGIGIICAVVAAVAFLLRLDILVGIFYFLALAAGFVMTLVLLGLAGGFNLMYPTIAVEGSDSFDAISRSFSYIYSKPWRMLFYSSVAMAYGALCYLFVKFFIWVMLVVTHFFVGLFVFRTAVSGDDLWPILNPPPAFDNLPFVINGYALSWYGNTTAFILSIWVYLVIAMLGAFAVSFYFSASTIIYYLMRRDTDATEMDDVYLEQPEEDFVEAAPAAAAAPAGAAPAAAVAVEAPAATPAGEAPAGGAATYPVSELPTAQPGEVPAASEATQPPGDAPTA